jgi:hypothetical protein
MHGAIVSIGWASRNAEHYDPATRRVRAPLPRGAPRRRRRRRRPRPAAHGPHAPGGARGQLAIDRPFAGRVPARSAFSVFWPLAAARPLPRPLALDQHTPALHLARLSRAEARERTCAP